MATFAGEAFRFMAPDALLAGDMRASWLIVDEAAAIPGPLLRQLVTRFPRTLLTTTVQGYEGTGRGFLLKFCASFPICASLVCLIPSAGPRAARWKRSVNYCCLAMKPLQSQRGGDV
jgi:hypothetical protein